MNTPEPTVARWHHAPLHVFVPGAVYMITAGTINKDHIFRGDSKLRLLSGVLQETVSACGWDLRVWAVFSNHYHFIAKAPDSSNQLGQLIKRLHSDAAREANRLDGTPGRQVWHQYWDKCLTYEKSYLARVKYVFNNAVHHGMSPSAGTYPYCTAGAGVTPEQAGFWRKVESFRCDRLNEPDEFAPVWP